MAGLLFRDNINTVLQAYANSIWMIKGSTAISNTAPLLLADFEVHDAVVASCDHEIIREKLDTLQDLETSAAE